MEKYTKKTKEKTSTPIGVYPGIKLKGKERYAKLYHYTSLNSFIRIWHSKKLLFASTSNVNDILEQDRSSSGMNLVWMYGFNDMLSKYRQISFTMSFDTYLKGCMSTMMWGHYGDKGLGVCIELDYTKLKKEKGVYSSIVKYIKYVPNSIKIQDSVTDLLSLRKFVVSQHKNTFFTKHSDWRCENEYRFISDEVDSLDISNAITAIYLTSCTSLECQIVESIVKDSVPVRFFYFNFSKNHKIQMDSDTKLLREDRARCSLGSEDMCNKAKAHYLKLLENEIKI